MREVHRLTVARGGALAALLLAASLPGVAHAQYIHNDAPPLPTAPPPGAYESPSDRLARNVRVLAQEPKNFAALIAAGRASLALGDLSSAEGFFGRADEIRPNDPAPKAGMAGAAVLSNNIDEAESWFARAQRLGANTAMIGADRGLLKDLKGDLSSAQSDYRAALGGPDPDEARRRYSLSLAMGGKMDEGLKILEPLLRERDPAALRIRAFVLALGGQKQAAVAAIEQAMPGSGGRIAPFFDRLAILSPSQQAAAVHLGIFPSDAEIRLAEARAAARPAAPVVTPAPARVAARKPAKNKNERRGTISVTYSPLPQPAPAVAPAAQAAPPQPAFSLPSATPVRVVQVSTVPVHDTQPVAEPAPEAAAEPAPEAAAEPAQQVASIGSDRLAGIDKLLAQTADQPLPPPPPPPRPKVETASKGSSKADSRKAEARKAAEAKKAEDAKKAAEEKALGVRGATWVQIAGGSNAGRMASEYTRIKAKKPALFAKRPGYVTQGKDYFRLLIGPFDDASQARDMVNDLAKAGIDSFMWTRTPPQIKIEKLPSS